MKRRDALRLLGLGATSLAAAGCDALPAPEKADRAMLRRESRRVRVCYTPAYAFETTRKARWVADSLAIEPIAGFCTFNGLAIAALRGLDQGLKRILIVDLDAHCGGGTHSVVADHPEIHHLDVAVDDFDQYQPAGANTLDLVDDAALYLPTIERRLEALGGEQFDLCLYNAGMDPHEHCRVGGLAGIDGNMLARREHLVFSWCRKKGLPVAFVLAGGYIGPALQQDALVALHRLTLTAASSR